MSGQKCHVGSQAIIRSASLNITLRHDCHVTGVDVTQLNTVDQCCADGHLHKFQQSWLGSKDTQNV